jgi:hypothetical protein
MLKLRLPDRPRGARFKRWAPRVLSSPSSDLLRSQHRRHISYYWLASHQLYERRQWNGGHHDWFLIPDFRLSILVKCDGIVTLKTIPPHASPQGLRPARSIRPTSPKPKRSCLRGVSSGSRQTDDGAGRVLFRADNGSGDDAAGLVREVPRRETSRRVHDHPDDRHGCPYCSTPIMTTSGHKIEHRAPLTIAREITCPWLYGSARFTEVAARQSGQRTSPP